MFTIGVRPWLESVACLSSLLWLSFVANCRRQASFCHKTNHDRCHDATLDTKTLLTFRALTLAHSIWRRANAWSVSFVNLLTLATGPLSTRLKPNLFFFSTDTAPRAFFRNLTLPGYALWPIWGVVLSDPVRLPVVSRDLYSNYQLDP